MFLHQRLKTAIREIQSCELGARPTGGTFTLTYSDETTTAIDYDATPSTIQTALETLSNIEAGDIIVSMTGPFSKTRFAEFIFIVGKVPLGLLVMNVSGLTTTTEATFTRVGDAPANSFGQIIGYNQANQSAVIKRPDDNNLGYCKTVIIPEGIPSGKNGVSCIDGIRVVKKASGESISPGDRVGTQKDGWFAKKDDYGMFYVIDVDGDYLFVRLCQMWPEIYIGGLSYGYNLLTTDREGRRVFDYFSGAFSSPSTGIIGAIDVDSEGKIYLAHSLSGDTTHEILSPTGKQIWSSTGTTGSSIRVREDGCYFLNYSYTYHSVLQKYNANNTLIWTYFITNTSHVYYITLGPNDTITIYVYNSTGGGRTIRRLTDNGDNYTVDWIYDIVAQSKEHIPKALAVDGSGNVYSGGQRTLGGSSQIAVMKLNNAGVFQWDYWGQRTCEVLAMETHRHG